MKKALTFIFCAVLLVGCATTKPETREAAITVQQEYIVRLPPAETMILPPAVPDIDLKTAKQSDVASWIVLKEARIDALESKLKRIAEFFNEPPK